MGISQVAWRNWCFEYGVIGEMENMATTPPHSNLITPRTSELVMSTGIASAACSIEVYWAGGRQVNMVALLNHNILGASSAPTFQIYDEDLNMLTPSSVVTLTFTGLEVQRHLFAYFTDIEDFNMNRVNRVVVIFPQRTGAVKYGQHDEYSDDTTLEELSIGGLWAGPIWQPTNGIRKTGWGQGITETKRGAVSIGGQEYRSAEARRRKMPFSFPLLLESEVYGMDVFPTTLQRVLSWVGTSRPLIVIPDAETPDASFMQAIYGYLDQDPSWTTVPGAGYTVTASITEAL